MRITVAQLRQMIKESLADYPDQRHLDTTDPQELLKRIIKLEDRNEKLEERIDALEYTIKILRDPNHY